MRKLFAMVATVAVVLSMFSGIAFAAPMTTPATAINVNGIAGTIQLTAVPATAYGVGDKPTFAGNVAIAAPTTYEVQLRWADETVIAEGAVAADGSFSFSVPTAAAATFTGLYKAGTVKLVVAEIATNANFAPVGANKSVVAYGAKIRLQESSTVSTGSKVGYYRVQGVVEDMNGAVVNATVANAISVGGQNVNLVNGTFDYQVRTDVTPTTISVAAAAAINGVASGDVKGASFSITYSADLNTSLDFNYSENPMVVLYGTLKDAAGNAIDLSGANSASVQLGYVDGNKNFLGPITPAVNATDKNGQFALAPISSWPQGAGDIGLFVDNVLVKSGSISAPASGLYLTASPNSNIVHSVSATTVKATLTNVPAGGYKVDFKLYKGSTLVTQALSVTPVTGKAETNLTSTFSNGAGSYTLKAFVKLGESVQYQTSTTLTVVDPVPGYALLDPSGKLAKLDVNTAPTAVTFGVTAGGVKQDVYLVNIGSNGQPTDPAFVKYVVSVDGTVKLTVDPKAATPTTNGSITLKTEKYGTYEVRVQAYVWDTTLTTPAYVEKADHVYTIVVNGWDLTSDVATMTVNQVKDITFTVKDKDGNPVNNAAIWVDGTKVVDSTVTNINNGTYVAKNVTFSTSGVHVITATKAGAANENTTVMAKLATGLIIKGEPVYTVTADVASLLLGKEQTVTLSTTEADKFVIPGKLVMQVGETVTYPSYSVADTNSDGVNDAIKVKITPAKVKDTTLRVTNANGSKEGEVVLTVVAPKLVLEGNQKATENVKSLLNFKVVDPRDNSILNGNVTLAAKNFSSMTMYAEDKKSELVGATLLGKSDLHKLYVLAKGADYDGATDAKENVEIALTIKLTDTVDVDGTILVAKAALVATPESVVLGQPVSLTLTYKNADGVGIEGMKIYLGSDDKGALVGTTDAQGQVTYAAAMPNTASLGFAAATNDTAKFVTLAVPTVLDTIAPAVSAPETTDKSTATITISDNVRVVRVMINGVEDTTFFPGTTYTKNVTLKVGANTFTVQAMDANYNTVNETVTITYTPAANNSTVLQGSAVVRKGENIFLQIREFENLGATLTYNATTKAATFTIGDKVVTVTAGSTTAMVNGVATTMPAAPYLANGRMMAPVRAILESLGMTVSWAAGDVITITK